MKKKFLLLICLLTALCCMLCACGEVPIDPPDPGLTLDRTSLTLMDGGEGQLTVSFQGEKTISWTVSDKSVVSVTADGAKATVKGLKEGTATVTAACDDLTATCTVTVKRSALSVYLPDGPTGSLKNGRLVLVKNGVATVRAMSDTPLTGVPKWSSSDESIGTVESQGLIARVKAVARGVCTITVECDGYSASFTLFVGKTA